MIHCTLLWHSTLPMYAAQGTIRGRLTGYARTIWSRRSAIVDRQQVHCPSMIQKENSSMATNQNSATVRRFWQGFNSHNLEIWDEVCTPDFINHDAGLPTPDADLPTIKETI